MGKHQRYSVTGPAASTKKTGMIEIVSFPKDIPSFTLAASFDLPSADKFSETFGPRAGPTNYRV